MSVNLELYNVFFNPKSMTLTAKTPCAPRKIRNKTLAFFAPLRFFKFEKLCLNFVSFVVNKIP